MKARSLGRYGSLATGAIALTSLALAMPASAAFPGRNGRIAVAYEPKLGNAIGSMAADGSDATELTTTDFGTNPVYSPSGNRIAFSQRTIHFPNKAIYLMAADGSNEHLVTATRNLVAPAFSPSGKQIVFAAQRICFVRVDGSNLECLPDTAGYHDPVFFPSGKRLAVEHLGDIRTMRVDGTHRHRLTHNGHSFVPDVSPNGRKIAYDFDKQTASSLSWIDVMRADGTRQHRLARGAGASFSPNGKKILFTDSASSFEPFGRDLYAQNLVMNADGSNPHPVTPAPPLNVYYGYVGPPDWGPRP